MLRRQVLLRCAALLCAPALPAWAESEATDAAVEDLDDVETGAADSGADDEA